MQGRQSLLKRDVGCSHVVRSWCGLACVLPLKRVLAPTRVMASAIPHDDAHCAFMTFPIYSRTIEDEMRHHLNIEATDIH